MTKIWVLMTISGSPKLKQFGNWWDHATSHDEPTLKAVSDNLRMGIMVEVWFSQENYFDKIDLYLNW